MDKQKKILPQYIGEIQSVEEKSRPKRSFAEMVKTKGLANNHISLIDHLWRSIGALND